MAQRTPLTQFLRSFFLTSFKQGGPKSIFWGGPLKIGGPKKALKAKQKQLILTLLFSILAAKRQKRRKCENCRFTAVKTQFQGVPGVQNYPLEGPRGSTMAPRRVTNWKTSKKQLSEQMIFWKTSWMATGSKNKKKWGQKGSQPSSSITRGSNARPPGLPSRRVQDPKSRKIKKLVL